MATNATVISYVWWLGVDELYDDYSDAINTFGIDLSTNSWGFQDWDGEYDVFTEAQDDVVVGASGKRIPLMWAAGNEGARGWTSLRSNAVVTLTSHANQG